MKNPRQRHKIWLYRSPDDVNPWVAFPLLVVFFSGILSLIAWTVDDDGTTKTITASVAKVAASTTTTIHEPDPLHNFDDWMSQWSPKLQESFHLKELGFNDIKDWWKISYVTADNRKCSGSFYAIGDTVYIQEGATCVKLLEPGQE